MDKSWISSNGLTNAYDEGVEDFLTFAQNNNVKSDVISCPCINCMNLCHHSIPAVRYHLFSNGFDEGYKVWTFHGENSERGPNKFVLPDFDHTKDMLDDAFFTDVEEEPDSLKTLLEEWIKWSGNSLLMTLNPGNFEIHQRLGSALWKMEDCDWK